MSATGRKLPRMNIGNRPGAEGQARVLEHKNKDD